MKERKEMMGIHFNPKKLKARQGQSLLEYTTIIVVVVAALAAMSLYVQRSVQANLKIMEDQINANPRNMDK